MKMFNVRSSGKVIWSIWLFVIIFLNLSFLECNITGSDIYVDHLGNDTSNCGKIKQPCRTIRYAVSRSKPNSRLFINDSNGPYLNESIGGYIKIDHNLTMLSSGTNRVTIQCTDGDAGLFNVSGKPSINGISTVLRLTKFKIQNCRSSIYGVVTLVNARIVLNNSTFSNNGVIFGHRQVTVNETACENIEVIVNNSDFKQNLISRPYQYAFSLCGCKNIKLDIENSRLYSSPVAVKSNFLTIVTFIRVMLDGSSLRGSSFYVALSPGDNLISFNNCTFTNHKGSRTSPVSIKADTSIGNKTSLTFSNVLFLKNQNLDTAGAAMTVVSQFNKNILPVVDVRLTDCLFEGNSAADNNGGAIYMAFVKLIRINRCIFRNNTGINGGAIYFEKVKDIAVTNSTFVINKAVVEPPNLHLVTRGGAIYAEACDLNFRSSQFQNNFAGYDGSSIFADKCDGISIVDTIFNESSNVSETSPRNSIVRLSTKVPDFQNATVNLINSRFFATSENICEQSFLNVEGHINVRNITSNCSTGRQVECSFETPLYYSTYFQYKLLAMWCEACPPGQYRVIDDDGCSLDSTPEFDLQKKSCAQCPAHASCENGVLKPDLNYWGLEKDNKIELHLCPLGYCSMDTFNCLGYQCCAPGRTGFLCNECIGNYVYKNDYQQKKCVPEDTCLGFDDIVKHIASACPLYCVLLLLLCLLFLPYNGLLEENGEKNILNKPESVGEFTTSQMFLRDRSTPPIYNPTICFLSFVYFFQLAPLVYSRSTVQDMGSFDEVINNILKFFNFHLVSFAACSQNFAILKDTAFVVAITFWGILALLAFSFFTLTICITSHLNSVNSEKSKMVFTSAIIFLCLLTYIPFLRASCQLFQNLLSDSTSNSSSFQILFLIYIACCIAPMFIVLEPSIHLLVGQSIPANTFLLICLFPTIGLIWLFVTFFNFNRSEMKIPVVQDFQNLIKHDNNFVPCQQFKPRPASCWIILQNYKTSSASFGISWFSMLLFRNFLLTIIGSLLKYFPVSRSVCLAVLLLIFTHHCRIKSFSTDVFKRFDFILLLVLDLLSIMDVCSSIYYISGWKTTTAIFVCDLFYSASVLVLIFLAAFLNIHELLSRYRTPTATAQ